MITATTTSEEATTTTEIPTTTTETVTTCPDGWVRREEFCYLLVEEFRSWQDASSYCMIKGGNLVSIHNKDEKDFILSKFLSNFMF